MLQYERVRKQRLLHFYRSVFVSQHDWRLNPVELSRFQGLKESCIHQRQRV